MTDALSLAGHRAGAARRRVAHPLPRTQRSRASVGPSPSPASSASAASRASRFRSIRQSEGEVRDTVISLGKQLGRRWYVGYERGVNATTGTWQLIYRVAQRFTLRAQSGQENSLDLIWTWRFDRP